MSEGKGRGNCKFVNTLISYLYRDASNYKVRNEAVVEGTLTRTQKLAIINSLIDGEFFIPSKVGLPEERFDSWTEDDHEFFELAFDGLTDTTRPTTVSITAKELYDNFIMWAAGKTRIATAPQNTEDGEFEYLLRFVTEARDASSTNEELFANQLLSLWTAYCLHKNMMCDTAAYDNKILRIWGLIEEDDKPEGCYKDFDGFDLFMGQYLC